jgi:hypothetical protein
MVSSAELLSATQISRLEYVLAHTDGRNSSRKDLPFQLKITTATRAFFSIAGSDPPKISTIHIRGQLSIFTKTVQFYVLIASKLALKIPTRCRSDVGQ